jgi:hypothetical protein
MMDRQTVLNEIKRNASAHLFLAAKDWLNDREVEDSVDRPAEILVSEAERLWRLRHENLLSRGKHLFGAEEFLSKLQTLNRRKKLQQFSFHGASRTGSVFYEKTSGKFVGFVTVTSVRKDRAALRDQTFLQAAG